MVSKTTGFRDPGHLFIVRGDVTSIGCDAWLLPADSEVRVESPWRRALAAMAGGSRHDDRLIDQALASVRKPLRCQELPGFRRENQGSPWVTDIAVEGDGDHQGTIDGLHRFVKAVCGSVTTSGRLRLAIPFIGSGEGGWGRRKGDLMLELVRAIADVISSDGSPDIVLVLRNDEAFAAAQYARQRVFAGRDGGAWPQLDDGARRLADDLAEKIMDDRLVVFIGAGASVSAGLPSWDGLLRKLAEDAGLHSGEDFAELPALDRAWLIERELADSPDRKGPTLGKLIKQRFSGNRAPSLVHQIIASLPVREFATTNYDCLFEDAARNSGSPVELIADGLPARRDRWLVKLHGTTTKPDSIVLSRGDYLDYASRRAALAGVVQAMLLTRHMLFVGFSLADDNFVRIAHDVRNALGKRPTGANPAGTALTLDPSAAKLRLWSDFIDIRYIDVSPGTPSHDVPDAVKARGVEILLDRALAIVVTDRMSYLLDHSFDGLLSKDDRAARDVITEAVKRTANNGSASAVRLRQLAERLGHEDRPQR